MQENNFLSCLRNPCENTFSKLQIFVFFIYKKGNSEYVKVLAVCNKQENIFFCLSDIYIYIYIYIYIFATFRGKTGYFNTRFVFPQYKNNKP